LGTVALRLFLNAVLSSVGLDERARVLGGKVSVRAADGGGTVVRV
jgi:hypothetical protein